MDVFRGFIESPLRKVVMGLVFVAFFAAKGQAQIGTPPIILVQPLGASVPIGGTAVITAVLAPSLTPQEFYWYLGTNLVVANSTISIGSKSVLNLGVLDVVSTLTINNFNATNAGNYSLRITNGVSSTISSNATLLVIPGITNVINIVASGLGMAAEGFKLQLSGPTGSNLVIQASTDLKNWASISTNTIPAGGILYTDTAAANFTQRYYRGVIR